MCGQKIAQRVSEVIADRGTSANRFALEIGLDPGNLRKMLAGKQTITRKTLQKISDAFCVNIDWLLTGEGEMLAEGGRAPEAPSSAAAEGGIPLLDIDASAGFSLVEPGGSGEGRTLSLPGCDGAIPVRGHSMEPEIHDGDIAGFVMLPSAASIRPDGIYIVQYDDAEGFRHVTIKRTKRSPRGEAYVRLASVNEEYGHEDVPLAAITRAAKVRFTLSILSY